MAICTFQRRSAHSAHYIVGNWVIPKSVQHCVLLLLRFVRQASRMGFERTASYLFAGFDLNNAGKLFEEERGVAVTRDLNGILTVR